MTASISRLSAELTVDSYASHVAARLQDFFADTTPWPRRLWDISSDLALREAYEAGRWQARQVISPGAVSWYMHSLERQLGPDRGLGDGRLRRHLTGLLRSGLPPNSPERRQLGQLLPTIAGGYLDRWRDAVDCGPLPSAERLARAIATQVLDLGNSSGQLHRWVRSLCEKPGTSLGDLLDGACALARRPDVTFEVLVPFLAVPDHARLAVHLPEWRSAAAAAAWFAANGVTRPPRQYGAFAFSISAKDATAAARSAGALVQRLQARATYARGEAGSRLEPVGKVWIAGHDHELPLVPPARGVDVLSLVREKTMYAISSQDLLDDALEMAAPLNAGPAAAAVSGGWSAIESLLSQAADAGEGRPGRVVAADRLAALVTCSWPRAELTALSYRHQPANPDALSNGLVRCQKNVDRSRAVADALAGGQALALTSPSDIAAAQRMSAVLDNPYKELADVRAVFESVLRRLYRQRNIVVHGGTTASVAMDATLRTAPPLVGAGLDRLVHAKLQTGVGPLDLAARAANSLELVGDSLGPHVVSLLE